MARMFILANLLKEANEIDVNDMRRQGKRLRELPLMNRNDDFVRVYRLSEDLIKDLEGDISHLLPRVQRRGRALSKKTKILCTLSFLANGSYQNLVGKNINTFVSQPSASRCIHEVIEALNHPDMVKKYIRFPQNVAERRALKERFFRKYKIPGVIGCVDGTFVSMVRPVNNEERYYCRKGYHARNIQLITDADLNILFVDPTFGGATHDSFIFNHSVIKDHLELLTNTGETVYLLGDSGYCQRAFLMTPVAVAEENSSEAHYNKMHAKARNTVERAIGMLKGRFRCLLAHRVLHYDPDMVAKIVIGCCVLHNICNRVGVPVPILNTADEEQEQDFASRVQTRQTVDVSTQAELAAGLSRRRELINNLWRARERT